MKRKRFIRTIGLFTGIALTAVSGGCGPTALSPADQQKVDALIQKEHSGRHKELNADLKAAKQLPGNAQKKQASARKAAHGGPG